MDFEKNNVNDDFVMENNVLKGITKPLPNNPQVGRVILDTLNSKPDHVSQIDAATGKRMTFSEMRDQSIRCGLWLRKQGIGQGDFVILCTHNHLDTCIPLLATFFVGAIHSAWHPDTTLDRARYWMSMYRPKAIFACESVVGILLEVAKLENLDVKIIVFGQHPLVQSLRDITQLQSAEEVRTFHPTVIESPEEIGFVILTSGSTGLPKGVVYSYVNILNLNQTTPVRFKNVSLWNSNHSWMGGFRLALRNILSCDTRIIPASEEPEDICQAIEKYAVQRIFVTSFTITYLCKSNFLDKYNLESLEMIMISGSITNERVLHQLRCNLPRALVFHAYGLTETAGGVVIQTNKCKNIGSVGYVGPNSEIKIADLETDQTLGPNQIGEIYMKTKTMMSGYYKNPEATRDVLNEGWLRTGDVGYYDENGEIFIIDRIKEMITYRNNNVSSSVIEQALLGHPDVLEAAVVPIPHDVDIEHPIAFVRKAADSTVTEMELVELSSRLGDKSKLRGGVKFLDALPKTHSGKVSRQEIKKMALALADNNRRV